MEIEKKYGVDILAFSKNKDLYHIDPSFIYRCMNLASILKSNNDLNYVGHIKRYSPSKNTKFLLLHRPVYSFSLELLIRRLKRKNIKVIADIDDLVIHPDFSIVSPAVVNNILDKKVVAKCFLRNYKALKLCDHLICSTTQLEVILKEYFVNTPITVLHNCVFHTWKLGIDSEKLNTQKIITYFPGTKSHDSDFNLIKKPLEAFLGDTPAAKLNIVGPLEFSLEISDSQLSHLPKVPFEEYEKVVQRSNINLAPLEESIFNNCKSALKAIEAGAFGIPTIFSPNEDAQRLNKYSVLIAKTESDWYNSLKKLFESETFDSSQCSINIRENANIKKVATKFYAEVLDCD